MSNLPPLQPNMMIQGLPYRVPQGLIPNVQVSQPMSEQLRDCAGFVLLTLQTAANNNAMRLLLYWTMAQNQFQNQGYQQLVSDTAFLAELTYKTQNGQYPIANCIEQAATVLCKAWAAKVASQHPSLIQSLDPQGAQDFQNTINQANQIDQQINFARQQLQQMGGGMGLGMGMGHQGVARSTMGVAGVAIMGGHGGHMGGGMGGFPANNQFQQRPIQGTDRLWNNNRGSGEDDYMMLAGTVISEKKNTQSIPPNGFSDPLSTAVPDHMLAGGIAAGSKLNQALPQENKMEPTPGNTNIFPVPAPRGPFEYMGTKLVYAAFCPKKDMADGVPHGVLYDTATTAIFYNITKPGSIREIGLKLEEVGGMQLYEEHETHHLLHPRQLNKGTIPDREAARKAFMGIVQAADISAEIQQRNARQGGTDDVLEKVLAKGPVFLDELILLGTSNPIYQAEWQIFLRDNAVDVPEDTVVGFHYKGAEKWTLTGEAAIKALSLKYAVRWSVLVQHVKQLKELIHPTYWNLVNERLTGAVNELIQQYLGINGNIDSFVDDLDDMRTALRGKYGDFVIDLFDKEAARIAKRTVLFVDNNETVENRDSLELERDPNLVEAQWLTMEDIFMLPCNAEDITYGHTGNAAMVTEKRAPELFAALKSHFDRQANDPDAPCVRHTKLITRDGKGIIYAIKSLYHDNSYIVYSHR